MWQHYYRPTTLSEAVQLIGQQPAARIVAGATDLTIELQHGIRPTDTLIDLTGVAELRSIVSDQTTIRIGALVTHNDLISSAYVQQLLPLAQACREIGAPQIRSVATIAGNLVTASPANDTITALMALDAEVELISIGGSRKLPLRSFYQGVRKTALQAGELLREIRIPALQHNQRGLFLKLGLRRAQAISVVNIAIVLRGMDEQDGAWRVSEARIALGCVAPTIIRCTAAEQYLQGRLLDHAACQEAAQLAVVATNPIDDLRSSADYRRHAIAALVIQGLERIAAARQAEGYEAQPVLLDTHQHTPVLASMPTLASGATIQATINGNVQSLTATNTLLNALRERAGLTGTKEGCAEGECGACTVWMNGKAVMACLVPAAQADRATITTIEGLAQGQRLHPLQQAFIDHGAVQCGFCTPGFLMAAAKLLEEHPHPTTEQIETAISGNLCRCTGYKQIVQAIQAAADRR